MVRGHDKVLVTVRGHDMVPGISRGCGRVPAMGSGRGSEKAEVRVTLLCIDGRTWTALTSVPGVYIDSVGGLGMVLSGYSDPSAVLVMRHETGPGKHLCDMAVVRAPESDGRHMVPGCTELEKGLASHHIHAWTVPVTSLLRRIRVVLMVLEMVHALHIHGQDSAMAQVKLLYEHSSAQSCWSCRVSSAAVWDSRVLSRAAWQSCSEALWNRPRRVSEKALTLTFEECLLGSVCRCPPSSGSSGGLLA